MLKIECKITPLLSYTITFEKDKNEALEKINDIKEIKQQKLKLGTAHKKDFVDYVLKFK